MQEGAKAQKGPGDPKDPKHSRGAWRLVRKLFHIFLMKGLLGCLSQIILTLPCLETRILTLSDWLLPGLKVELGVPYVLL